MTRSYQSADARVLVKSPPKVAALIIVKEAVIEAQPLEGRCFLPGDIVSFRSNTRGTILAVSKDGIQVDFGLGSSWFNKDVLTLVKAVSST